MNSLLASVNLIDFDKTTRFSLTASNQYILISNFFKLKLFNNQLELLTNINWKLKNGLIFDVRYSTYTNSFLILTETGLYSFNPLTFFINKIVQIREFFNCDPN
ncbi:unnamed protein product [Didymodactylos carnosus]|uniref:Uncharacterized protein n=1 Tax=Didymodactylos carnosus TaxID=1234261 RepID=A0A814RF91_9BILA|nr:unnamed protein product [Didymodactylos carnosus]CAF1132664.1 unnamed protein product [Didymodactylos carnosus]CAF3695814.1 unnamed protein product [Didymodactylos carnosus]CAF3896480.1 unnamed protein product [Didymodactylos carnosus]